jgi:hypothetical protein
MLALHLLRFITGNILPLMENQMGEADHPFTVRTLDSTVLHDSCHFRLCPQTTEIIADTLIRDDSSISHFWTESAEH